MFELPSADLPVIRADLTLAELAIDGTAAWATAWEIQLRPDLHKQWTTPHYRTGLRLHHECPAWVIVLSPDPRVRAAFRERMFGEEPELRPYIVEPEMVTPIRDLDAAVANYAWAVLATTLHADAPDIALIAKIAVQAVLRNNPPEGARYIQLIANAIGAETMNQIVQELPDEDQEPLSDWERRGASFVRGKAEGVAEGRAEGRAEGLRVAVREVLAARGLALSVEASAWLDACDDAELLRATIARAATVTSATELLPVDAER